MHSTLQSQTIRAIPMKGMKIPKPDCQAMELVDYNIALIQIKGSNNILADAISRLKTLEIYSDLIDNPKMLKAIDLQQDITEVKHKQNAHLKYKCTVC